MTTQTVSPSSVTSPSPHTRHRMPRALILLPLIEEFVTRDGAVHGHTETPLPVQVDAVRRQLEAGTIQIVFDEESETWTVLPIDPGTEARRSAAERH